ncbi:MAG: hypothetical protein ACHQ50_05320 [Fimbriimonadales bacterium]
MIFHLALEANAWPPNEFLKGWGKEIAPIFQTGMFHELADTPELPIGTYLFSDLEMATALQRQVLGQVWDQLEAHQGSRLFNNPMKVKPRYELLRSLYDEGGNDFRIFLLDEIPKDLRFPVFVRIATDHYGSRTPLLQNWRELDAWLVRAALGVADPTQLVVTEFAETKGADGLYRKYSAFLVGDLVVAKHVHFSREWMLKMPDLASPETLAEEREFMETIPFEKQIREVFRLGNIGYGRMDFSFRDGRMQVWEINTNPVITLAEKDIRPEHLPAQKRFAAKMVDAFRAIDTPSSGARVPIRLSLQDTLPRMGGTTAPQGSGTHLEIDRRSNCRSENPVMMSNRSNKSDLSTE